MQAKGPLPIFLAEAGLFALRIDSSPNVDYCCEVGVVDAGVVELEPKVGVPTGVDVLLAGWPTVQVLPPCIII